VPSSLDVGLASRPNQDNFLRVLAVVVLCCVLVHSVDVSECSCGVSKQIKVRLSVIS